MPDYIDIDRIKRQVENMSTESGKRCVECKQNYTNTAVKLCPLHSMAEKLAEIVRVALPYLEEVEDRGYPEEGFQSDELIAFREASAKALAAYDKLQGMSTKQKESSHGN